MKSILVTGVGSTTGLSVIKGLREHRGEPLRVVGTDIHDRAGIAGSAFCDAFHRVPAARSDAYVGTMFEVCAAERVDVVFPINDLEVEALARHSEEFRKRDVHVWTSSIETVTTCNDKHLTYQFLKAHGFETPATMLPDEAVGAIDSLSFPLIVKPRRGVSSQDVFRVDDQVELEQALKRVSQPIVQQYVDGPEFTVDVVSDAKGVVLSSVPRERLETKAGISYKARTIRNPTLIDEAARLAASLGILGPCNIQYRIAHGRPTCIEINPRFSAALPLTTAAGVNAPSVLVNLARGLTMRPDELRFDEGVLMLRYWSEVFIRPN